MAAVEKLNKALKEGYYIEVTALCESFIGDRQESLIFTLKGDEVKSYLPASKSASVLLDRSLNLPEYLTDLLHEVLRWSDCRNNAVHEMCKLDEAAEKTFEERYKEIKATAKDGIKLFRNIDNAIRKYRRELKRQAKA